MFQCRSHWRVYASDRAHARERELIGPLLREQQRDTPEKRQDEGTLSMCLNT